MYRNTNEAYLKELKENESFLNARIDEIEQYIERLKNDNQTIAPITQSVLELNKNMKSELINEIKRLDA